MTNDDPTAIPTDEAKLPATVLLGPPGAGKGTQGRVLGMIPGFLHWEAGRVLRALDPESEVGRRAREVLARGDLLDDETVIAVFRDSLRAHTAALAPSRPILVLDGLPRTIGQAQRLMSLVDVIVVLHLVAPDPERLVSRLALRAGQEGRADDGSEAIVRHRLEVYRRATEPVLREFPADLVVEIDAMRDAVVVTHDILGRIIERRR